MGHGEMIVEVLAGEPLLGSLLFDLFDQPGRSRILRVVSGGWICARIFIGPWQRGRSSTSIANTRRIDSPHE